jgi:hypothetical protein
MSYHNIPPTLNTHLKYKASTLGHYMNIYNVVPQYSTHIKYSSKIQGNNFMSLEKYLQ